MGVAKAALEASVRYLAADLGPQGHSRQCAVGWTDAHAFRAPVFRNARVIFNFQRDNSPLQRTPTLDDVAGSALYLLSPMSGAVTGEVHFVDCGYNTVSMPSLQSLKEQDAEAKPAASASPSAAAE